MEETMASDLQGSVPAGEHTPPHSGRRRGHVYWWVALALVIVAAGGAAHYALSHDPDGEPTPKAAVLAVNTVSPKRLTLVRTLEQPGSILPYAEVELYAKASGYLMAIRRELTACVVATLLAQPLLSPAVPGAALVGEAARSAGAVAMALHQAPVIDIGSQVSAGEVLMAIDVPEREQDLAGREAVVRQREEELAQTETMVGTYRAAVEVAQAHEAQAQADVKRYHGEYKFRMKELARVSELVRHNALEYRLQDEKQAQVDAALAAWESSRAKVKSAQADLALARSKLATAAADVRVKKALLDVARTDVLQALIVLDYGRLRAPFSGIITYRAVDEGDFVQNSRTGQSRHLMTVTAIDKVKVGLKVSSRVSPLVRVGAEATMMVDSLPGEKFYGRVSRTRRALDLQSRTLEVEIDLDNRDHRLMPGMYGHVTLTLQTKPNTWVVPAAALVSRNKVNYVILVHDGVARRQPVRIVFDHGDQVEVVKLVKDREVPLDGTEELVVSGKGEIADGQRVRSPRKDEG
jgi:RND family efflux transporter MFP subunit